jgi:hypothetical protein
MSVALAVTLSVAVALVALLVALFALVALVGVYARVRALEAGHGAGLAGYTALVGRPAPQAVRPVARQRVSVVAVLDADCALCDVVWEALAAAAARTASGTARFVGLVDRPADLVFARGRSPAELMADLTARADLYEGYSPTLLTVDAGGTIVHRSFVYPDTDVTALLRDLTDPHVVTRR